MIKSILNIKSLLSISDRKNFYFIVIMAFFAAILETVSIASFLPLIEYFSGKNVIGTYVFIENLNILNQFEKIYLLIFILFFIFAIKNIFLTIFYWVESKIIFKAKMNLTYNLFEKYLYQDFKFHVNKNSANLISKLNVEMDIFENCLSFIIILFVDITLLIFLFTFLFFLNPTVSLILFLFAFIFLFLLYALLKKRTKKIGSERVKVDALRQKIIQQSLDGIKELIVFNNRNFFLNYFKDTLDQIRDFVTKFTFINKFQKNLIEMITVTSLIGFIIFLVNQNYDLSQLTAFIGVYLLAIIKIIPSINKVVTANNYLQYANNSLSLLNKDIELKIKDKENLNVKKNIYFNDKISFKNVTLKYEDNLVLDNLNIDFKKNEFVGIVGDTGSGKSSLSHILLGLIESSKGQIKCDQENILDNVKSYQKNIGYVPQNIFLLDDTIKNNITFGIDHGKKDNEKIKKVIKLSALENFISKTPNGLEQIVGEKGIKISGGEKQRIGIARALYREPKILILDEPTSALDELTEKSIIKELFNLKHVFTIILITHKLGNLDTADKIIRIENKKIINVK